MRILVTGGLGAIGQPLVAELRRRGYDVWLCDRVHHPDPRYRRCDVGEWREIEALFGETTFDLVYHLAGEFGRHNGEEHYEAVWRTNAVGTKNVLRMQEQQGFRMVFASSSEVYGEQPVRLSEDLPARAAVRPLNDYAISKWVNEQQILNSAERHGTSTVRFRLFNVYGPGEPYSVYRSMVCRFVYSALHDLPYRVYTDHGRSVCFVDDAVRSIANIAERFKPGEVYNIGSEETRPVKEISDAVLRELGKSDRLVEYRRIDAHNVVEKQCDARKAVRDLEHHNAVGLEEGIRRTIAWQLATYGEPSAT